MLGRLYAEPVSRAKSLVGKLPKQSPAPAYPQIVKDNPSTASNMQIEEEPTQPKDHQRSDTTTIKVSECDDARLGECTPETNEENQLPFQESLSPDTSDATVPDDAETIEIDMKNNASTVEPADGTADPKPCVPLMGESAQVTSDASVTSPPKVNSEGGISIESKEQLDKLPADVVGPECSEDPAVSGKRLNGEDLNDSAVLPGSGDISAAQVVKAGDGDTGPDVTECVPGTPPLTSENQTTALAAVATGEETIIEDQKDPRSPMVELCRPPISPISPAEKDKLSQSPSVTEPNGEPDLIDACNDSSSQAVDPPNQVQTAADIPLIDDTPTKAKDQDSPDEEDRTTQFDDDKERLKSFLLRTQASKANKQTSITRRESLQNRRDSDVVRKALSSPRPALEEKDANTSSPTRVPSLLELSKQLESVIDDVEDCDVTARVDNQPATKGLDDTSSGLPSLRRSARKQSRIPQLPTANTAVRTPKKINVRRTDGNETLVLTAKKEAQELAQLTRNNTRKNKGGAFPVMQRLIQLTVENVIIGPDAPDMQLSQDSTTMQEEQKRKKKKKRGRSVHWDEKLTHFKEVLVLPTSPTASDESSTSGGNPVTHAPATPRPKKMPTARVRRLRGLGTANGTPAKGLLASTLLPDEVAEQREAAAAKENEKLAKPQKKSPPKAKAGKKDRLPSPKKLELRPSVASVNGGVGVVGEGKENPSRLHVGSPRKGPLMGGRVMIQAPAVEGDEGMGAVPARKRVARKM